MEFKERQEYMSESWGTGRLRGGCAKGITGSLFQIKGDEYSLSRIMFLREQKGFSGVHASSALRWLDFLLYLVPMELLWCKEV